MDKMNDVVRNRISVKDKDDVQEMYDSDSSGQDGSESENEKILKAVNTIIKTSLKRTRGLYKTQNAKRMKVVRDRRQGRQAYVGPPAPSQLYVGWRFVRKSTSHRLRYTCILPLVLFGYYTAARG